MEPWLPFSMIYSYILLRKMNGEELPVQIVRYLAAGMLGVEVVIQEGYTCLEVSRSFHRLQISVDQ